MRTPPPPPPPASISTISFEPRRSGRRSLAAAGVNGARSPIDDATHVVLVVQIVVERHELAHQEFRRVSNLEVIIIIIARVVALRRLLPSHCYRYFYRQSSSIPMTTTMTSPDDAIRGSTIIRSGAYSSIAVDGRSSPPSPPPLRLHREFANSWYVPMVGNIVENSMYSIVFIPCAAT